MHTNKVNFSSITTRFASTIAATCISIHPLWGAEQKTEDPVKFHPQVFSMILGWNSDNETPVATEMNLDAIEKNQNQFPQEEIKEDNGWIVFREGKAAEFKRYRLIENKVNHYKVEYQENSGGTFTSSSILEFDLTTREITIDSKTQTTRVLRMTSCNTKS